MIRYAVMLYPLAFRRRYGAEIVDLLEHSEQPARHALDVAVHAVHLHSEVLVNNWFRHTTNALLAASLVLLGYVVNDLSNGVTEIHRHWWSTLPVALVVAAAGARAVVTHRRSPTVTPQR